MPYMELCTDICHQFKRPAAKLGGRFFDMYNARFLSEMEFGHMCKQRSCITSACACSNMVSYSVSSDSHV